MKDEKSAKEIEMQMRKLQRIQVNRRYNHMKEDKNWLKVDPFSLSSFEISANERIELKMKNLRVDPLSC